MGESHPAAKKVVLQFCPKDLPNLTEDQRLKLIKLVGTRYNPDNDIIKMACEKFEAPAQNKRYLGDLVNKLIDEAKNGVDSFKDIPLDLRHRKPKKTIKFPEEWRLNPERVQELLLARKEQRLLAEAAPVNPLDGKNLVHSYVQSLAGTKMPSNRIL
jgi:small subunit ribosomal protein S35